MYDVLCVVVIYMELILTSMLLFILMMLMILLMLYIMCFFHDVGVAVWYVRIIVVTIYVAANCIVYIIIAVNYCICAPC